MSRTIGDLAFTVHVRQTLSTQSATGCRQRPSTREYKTRYRELRDRRAFLDGRHRFGYSLNDMQRVDDFFCQGIPSRNRSGRSPQLSTALGFSTSAGESWLVEVLIWSIEQKFSRTAARIRSSLAGRLSITGRPYEPRARRHVTTRWRTFWPTRQAVSRLRSQRPLYGNNSELEFLCPG